MGEGPLWDVRQNRLYWLDIVEGKIHRYDPATHKNETFAVGKYVSSVTPTIRGDFLITKGHAIYKWRPEHKMEKVISAEQRMAGNRFNDGKCDPAGRFWVGSMDMKEERQSGSLYRLSADLSIKKMCSGLTVSNGIDWSPGNETMYHVDSPTRRIFAYDFDLDGGTISRKRVAITIPEGNGFPDGITVDCEGNIWVAQWGGSRISRWEPEGRLLEEISVPASQVSSCTFGGRNLDTLYVTTARYGIGRSQVNNEVHAGSLFSIVPGVRGRAANKFNDSRKYSYSL